MVSPEANGFRDWCRSECLRLLGSEGKEFIQHPSLIVYSVSDLCIYLFIRYKCVGVLSEAIPIRSRNPSD